MASFTLGENEFTYERVAKNRSENVYEMVIVAESRTGELSVRRFELDVDARDDLSTDAVREALEDWQAEHDNLTLHRFVVEETNRCAYGTRIADPATADAEAEDAEGPRSPPGGASSEAAPLYRGSAAPQSQITFDDVGPDMGDEVEYYVAGPSTTVYGTDTGEVTGVKSGTDEYNVLLVETDTGTHRVREDWLVDGEDDEDGDE